MFNKFIKIREYFILNYVCIAKKSFLSVFIGSVTYTNLKEFICIKKINLKHKLNRLSSFI